MEKQSLGFMRSGNEDLILKYGPTGLPDIVSGHTLWDHGLDSK